MSVDSDTTPDLDPFRLQFCPRCDYSLQGLPENGICPECGRAYDHSFVIVRGGFGAGAYGGRQPKSARRWLVSWIGVLLLFGFLISRGRLRLDPFILFFIGYAVLMIAVTVVEWLTSPRAGESLLWISREGVGQQNDFDPDALHSRLRRILPAIYRFGFPTVLTIPLLAHATLAEGLVILSIALAILGISLVIWRLNRPRIAVAAAGTTPALLAWNQFHRIEIYHRDHDRHELRFQRITWVQKRYLIVAFFSADGRFVDALRERIYRWSGHPVFFSPRKV